MYTRTLAVLALAIAVSVPAVQAQNLFYYTESAAFDSLRNRYLISNQGNGNIIAVDSNGTHSYFATMLSCSKGLFIQGDTLFVAASTYGLVTFDLETADTLFRIVFPGQVDLNDVACDSSGNVYVSDAQGNMIHKLHLSDMSTETIVTGFTMANGLLFDEVRNRLLACQWMDNSPISAIDLDDYSVTTVAFPGLDLFDGLTEDNDGNILFASFGSDAVFRYDSSFSEPPEMVSCCHADPGDIFYNKRDDILVVPNITNATRVDFVDFSQPDLYVDGRSIVDTLGSSIDCILPGQTADIYPIIGNTGHTIAGAGAVLTSHNIFVTVIESSAMFSDSLPTDGKASSSTPFRVSVLPTCPCPMVAVLGVQIVAGDGYIKEDSLLLFIGNTPGFHDDMDSGIGYWRHRSVNWPFGDHWRQDQSCYHSDTVGWRSGNPVSYYNLMDAELITPPFLLDRHSALSFWHRIDAEVDTETGRAWDGGMVLISTRDGVWTQITPREGYPFTTIVGPSSPLRSETPVFSGDYDWAEAKFDLTGYSGIVQVMFRFTSNEAAAGAGWCIDDIDVAIDPTTCCVGTTGNVDYDPEDIADIGDLTSLIAYLFISYEEPTCLAEANIDGDDLGVIDIGDLTTLIDYLFISNTPPAECQ
ncbi:MAG TPA: SMP-30/gluconolactonase/LRE family protein [Sedimentisphaerales bacterium]|nr:SMP-30/gluconolactonase/LRE family protein [Sedimentisphaerales bacterium]